MGFRESVNIGTTRTWRLQNIRHSIGDCDIEGDT